jgi:y4mF family transcriptional regulator
VTIRSIRDLAAAVRGRRKDLGMNQAQLAERAGVSRKWIYEFEAGKATAEFGLLLSVLDELGLTLELTPRSETNQSGSGDTVDLDALLDEHRGS